MFTRFSSSEQPYKQYPRDWIVPGRIRVRLQDENGAFVHSEVQTRKDLMKEMGDTIPTLQSRVDRLAKQAQAATASAASTSSHSKKKGKKKGKKK